MNVPPKSETSLPKVIQAIDDLARGGSNALAPAEIELVSGDTETVVQDRLCAEASIPVLVPTSAAAAASGWFIKAVQPGAFMIGHNLVPPGARFRYELRRN